MPSENVDEIATYFKSNKANANQSQALDNLKLPTIANILNKNLTVQREKDEKKISECFNPVINFPNFLLPVLRVYQEKIKTNSDPAEIQLDDTTLLNNLDVKNLNLRIFNNSPLFYCNVVIYLLAIL